jgi:SAM-dependent methyltransferase
MLLDDVTQTIGVAGASLQRAKHAIDLHDEFADLHLESLGISEEEKQGIVNLAHEEHTSVDPVVAFLIGATSGYMYKHLIGNLDSYPIPHLRLVSGNSRTFLDIGCNWGRWCIAAAQKGFSVVGIDPSLGAIMAARRVSAALNLPIKYLVGDARYLPFRTNSFDNVFSYSVLQHLSREDASLAVSQVGRVLKVHGKTLIQMPTRFGPRCIYHQARRGFREAQGFEVRYWSIPALARLFSASIGRAQISVDCYFAIGLQASDWHLMPTKLKGVLLCSEMLRKLSVFAPVLKYVADSVYVTAVKNAA